MQIGCPTYSLKTTSSKKKVCADEERQEQMVADKKTRRLGREAHQKAVMAWEKRESERC